MFFDYEQWHFTRIRVGLTYAPHTHHCVRVYDGRSTTMTFYYRAEYMETQLQSTYNIHSDQVGPPHKTDLLWVKLNSFQEILQEQSIWLECNLKKSHLIWMLFKTLETNKPFTCILCCVNQCEILIKCHFNPDISLSSALNHSGNYLYINWFITLSNPSRTCCLICMILEGFEYEM